MRAFKRFVGLILLLSLKGDGPARAVYPGFGGNLVTTSIVNQGALSSVGPNNLNGPTVIQDLVVNDPPALPGGYIPRAGNYLFVSSGPVSASTPITLSTTAASFLMISGFRSLADSPPGLSLGAPVGALTYWQSQEGVSGITQTTGATTASLDLTDHNIEPYNQSARIAFNYSVSGGFSFDAVSVSSDLTQGDRKILTWGDFLPTAADTVTIVPAANFTGTYWYFAQGNGANAPSANIVLTSTVATTAALTGTGPSSSPLGVNSSSVAVYDLNGNLSVPYGVKAASLTATTITSNGSLLVVSNAAPTTYALRVSSQDSTFIGGVKGDGTFQYNGLGGADIQQLLHAETRLIVGDSGGYTWIENPAWFSSSLTASSITVNASTRGLDVISSKAGDYAGSISNTAVAGSNFGLQVYAGQNASDKALNVVQYPSASPLLIVQGGGNVGIGTASPNSKLHMSSGTLTIDGNVTAIANLNNCETGGTQVCLNVGDIAPAVSGLTQTGGLRIAGGVGNRYAIDVGVKNSGVPYAWFQTGNNEALGAGQAQNIALNPLGGNVGVNTAFAATSLDVNGAAQFGSGATKSTMTATGDMFIAAQAEVGLGAFTTAQIQAKTPNRAGTLIYNSSINQVCVSTGTTIQGYGRIASPTTACQ